MSTFKLKITCDIPNCTQENGFIELDSSVYKEGEVTKEELGISDSRCDAHVTEHGRFRDLVDECLQKTDATPLEAEMFVKANRKRQDFDIALREKIATIDEGVVAVGKYR